MQRLKVLHVTTLYPRPDDLVHGVFVKAQIDSLRDAGIDCSVHAITVAESYRPSTFLEVRRRLKKEAYDLVHAHYGYSLMPCMAARRIPLVVSFCGSDILGRIGNTNRQTFKGKVLVALSNFLALTASACITKSEEMKQKIWLPSVRRKTVVIPNAVDFELFRPLEQSLAREKLGLAADRRLVLFAGRADDPRKQLGFIEEAMVAVKTRLPSAELLVASGIPQELLRYYYSAADCLALASIHEGSPNVVKEAMACNLPVVSVDVGDVRELIGGTPGYRIVSRSSDAMAEGIVELLKHPRRTEGRQSIDRLRPEKIADRIRGVYTAALG